MEQVKEPLSKDIQWSEPSGFVRLYLYISILDNAKADITSSCFNFAGYVRMWFLSM